MTLRVLHVIPSVAPCRGGPSKAVLQMVDALNKLDTTTEVVATNDACENILDVELNKLTTFQKIPIRFFARHSSKITSLREFQYSNDFRQWLKKNIQQYDLIHVHAIFSFCSSYAMTLARSENIPYIVRPIGQLENWSLQQKSLKKKIYLTLWEQKNILHAGLVHFTSTSEKQQALNALAIKSSEVIPLGVNLPEIIPNAAKQLRAKFNLASDSKIILYLSRIHKKKGLEQLIKSFAQLKTDDTYLFIAGDGDKTYLNELITLIDSLDIVKRVRWLGFVQQQEKQLLLQGANIYALTSHSENFGISVLEALAAGTPALVSKEVALSQNIAEAKIGYVCDNSIASITNNLNSALGAPNNLGEDARRYASKNFQWSKIAQQLSEEYQKLILN